MRTKTILFFCFIASNIILLAQTKTEQFSASVGIGVTDYYNLGITPQYNLRIQRKTNKNGDAIFLSLAYEPPYKLNYSTEAVAIENGTKPSLIIVPYTIEYTFYNGTINYLYNLTDYDDEENDKDKNYYYYIFGGIGAGYIKNNYQINTFDNINYRIFYTELVKNHNFIGINADFGFGANYNWNNLKFFGEGKISLIQTFLTEKLEPNNKPIISANLMIGVGYLLIK
ncbi:MAG: hypothetical protein ACOYMA_01885 [Bacteroidia bacterium]